MKGREPRTYQFEQNIVANVARMIAQFMNGRMAKHDGSLGRGHHVQLSLMRGVRHVDDHSETIHFGDYFTSEIGETTIECSIFQSIN